ncbi:hypothetical protein [Halomonas urumqiensis]|uniref:Uncharacterized protein n=1 Tax=Halomonas urumqiensis TaxID=1684789 RepID=A0A2N7UHP0_9GAMM|nr:hypothetical protein [Halomonas urumqiensis]PMR79932.1 hypothetical protein C1H70_10700 [Halomonas urumqiensis]PTB02043.1 hypothetical protein C6V82_10055 [Halomonas urumqiensis]GHE21482.1 hypothetical protein GCM10017767_20030 [Halomonas urumqiensis]
MKINVEFDLTPDEFRQALGLPDISAFQQDLLGHIQKQMESGVEGYDPMSLMQPFMQQSGMTQGLSQGLSQGLASFGNYQQMMLDMLRQAGQGTADKEAPASGSKGDTAATSEKKAASRSASKGTASASSRSSRKSG